MKFKSERAELRRVYRKLEEEKRQQRREDVLEFGGLLTDFVDAVRSGTKVPRRRHARG